MNVLSLNDQGAGAILNLATNLVLSGLANMAHYVSAKSVGAMRVLSHRRRRSSADKS
jgi:hypothetical protein